MKDLSEVNGTEADLVGKIYPDEMVRAREKICTEKYIITMYHVYSSIPCVHHGLTISQIN